MGVDVVGQSIERVVAALSNGNIVGGAAASSDQQLDVARSLTGGEKRSRGASGDGIGIKRAGSRQAGHRNLVSCGDGRGLSRSVQNPGVGRGCRLRRQRTRRIGERRTAVCRFVRLFSSPSNKPSCVARVVCCPSHTLSCPLCSETICDTIELTSIPCPERIVAGFRLIPMGLLLRSLPRLSIAASRTRPSEHVIPRLTLEECDLRSCLLHFDFILRSAGPRSSILCLLNFRS